MPRSVSVVLGLLAGCTVYHAQQPAPITPLAQPTAQPVLVQQPVAQPVAQPVLVAQPQPADVASYGALTLSTGFLPDPATSTGYAGGALNAQSLAPHCRGYIGATPSHILYASTYFSTLRILVNGGNEDLTLVVQRPDGSYACNDDAEGRHPIVASTFAAGTYRIFVGTFRPNVSTPYTIGLSELDHVTASSLGASYASSSTYASNFGTVYLTPGFVPDPHVETGTSGGSMPASNLAVGCAGWITERPDHVLELNGHFGFLRTVVHSSGDTTLVVQTPQGQYLCNDDYYGTDPSIEGRFGAGTYRVWVGSYRQGEGASYRIGFSELSSTTSSSL